MYVSHDAHCYLCSIQDKVLIKCVASLSAKEILINYYEDGQIFWT